MIPPLLLLLLGGTPDTLKLSFDEALRLALRASPVRAEVSATRLQSATTLAQGVGWLLPSVSATLGYGRSETRSLWNPDSTYSERGWTGSLTVSQVVFDPAVFGTVVAALANARAEAIQAQDQAARLLYDVTVDYLGLLKAQWLSSAAAAACQQADENYRLIQERERLGSATRIDLLRAKAFRSQAEIELQSANTALAIAQETFKATAGITEDIPVVATETLTGPAQLRRDNADSLLAEIECQNPGVAMAAKASAAAAAGVVGAAGRALPALALRSSYSYSDTTFPCSRAAWAENDVVSYGITATFPLLDLKSFVINLADACGRYRRARAAATQARLQLRSSAIAAILGYHDAQQRYESARDNLELNQELYRLAQEQQRLGAMSLTDFFAVEANLAQAQVSYISALSDSYVQAAQINYLLGRTRPIDGQR